jgi:hypothetical protein
LACASLDEVVGDRKNRHDPRPRESRADVDRDFGEVRPRDRDHFGQAFGGNANEGLAGVSLGVKSANLFRGDRFAHAHERRREDAAHERRRHGHEAKRDALRTRVRERLFDLGHVLMGERLVRSKVARAHGVMCGRGGHDARTARARNADGLDLSLEKPRPRERKEPELDGRREATRRSDPFRLADGLAVLFRQPIDERSEERRRRVRAPVVALVRGRALQSEVTRQIDDPNAGPHELRDLDRAHPMRQPEQHHVDARGDLFRRQLFEPEIGRPF